MPYANKNDLVLSVPESMNVIRDFQFKKILMERKDFPSIMNLIRYLQSTNQILAIAYACHRLIRSSLQNPKPISDDEINAVFDKNDLILREYNFSVKAFITYLKIAVDQLIIMSHSKEKIDSIGKLLGSRKLDCLDEMYEKKIMKFFVGLNILVNHLKHDPLSFSSLDQILDLDHPGIVVLIPKKGLAHEGFKYYFGNGLSTDDDFYFPLQFFVQGFNSYWEYLKTDS